MSGIAAREIVTGAGDSLILAPDDDSAQAYASALFGYPMEVRFLSWFEDVGWDDENYGSKEEFDRESGFTGWWRPVENPINTPPSESLLHGYEVSVITPAEKEGEHDG